MAKAKGWLANLLSKAGGRIFSVLTRCEENGVMPRATRWLRVGVLGVIASLVVSLSLQAEDSNVLCYVVARLPDADISEVGISPSPTNGADSVKVKATAVVFETGLEDNFISGARFRLGRDTLWLDMEAVDGKFDDTLEVIEGNLYVGHLKPETTWIYINVTTSQDGWESEGFQLIVTESDSTGNKDTQEEK